MSNADAFPRGAAHGATPLRPPVNAAAARSKPGSGKRSYSRWHTETRIETEDDGWLLTYLDVITLMLVMMVVMLSFAGPPGGVKAPEKTVADATAVADADSGESIVPPVPLPIPLPYPSNEGSPTPPQQPVPRIQLDTEGKDIQVLEDKDLMRFRISSELLFGSGDATLSAGARPVLNELVTLFRSQPDMRIVVEGHTDNVPINTERFPSNWELSTARAAAVARYLIEQGVAPQRVQASGFADTRPLAAPGNPVDRATNRRVELTMETPLPAAPVR